MRNAEHPDKSVVRTGWTLLSQTNNPPEIDPLAFWLAWFFRSQWGLQPQYKEIF
jgi:hypothetical protein